MVLSETALSFIGLGLKDPVNSLGVMLQSVTSAARAMKSGISGYYGGWIDSVLQMATDAVRTIPAIPLFMALAAFVPDTWSAEQRFFFISLILGFIGWPTLARRVRTHLLTERNQEYVLAAQLCGASAGHIIRRHLLPRNLYSYHCKRRCKRGPEAQGGLFYRLSRSINLGTVQKAESCHGGRSGSDHIDLGGVLFTVPVAVCSDDCGPG